jgi:hypothetical protein
LQHLWTVEEDCVLCFDDTSDVSFVVWKVRIIKYFDFALDNPGKASTGVAVRVYDEVPGQFDCAE